MLIVRILSLLLSAALLLPYPAASAAPAAIPDETDETDRDDGSAYTRAIAARNQVYARENAVLDPTGISVPESFKDYTLMVYIVGSDLEGEQQKAGKDIREMQASGIDFAKSNVLVSTGGCQNWSINIPGDSNYVLDLSRGEDDWIVASTRSHADMGAPETLSEFIRFCTGYYPAEHYALILWDHGAGPLLGFGADVLFGDDSLLLPEMKAAMDTTIVGTGEARLGWVGFDACPESTPLMVPV